MKNLNCLLQNACVISLVSFGSCGISKNAIPPEMKNVGDGFNQALQAGDLNALIKYVHFPIESNEFGTIDNQTKLKALFPKIFPKERVNGLKGQVPTSTPDGNFELTSVDKGDPIRFLFKKFGSEYRLYCIDNINE